MLRRVRRIPPVLPQDGDGLPAAVRMLRAAHTGSVNDYGAYAVAGLLAVIATLTLT